MLFTMTVTEANAIPEQLVTEAEMQVTADQLNRLDQVERSSVNRATLYNEGYEAGFKAAADDYCNEKVGLEVFDKLRDERDITDFYAIGFEMGYFRKLAEIAVL